MHLIKPAWLSHSGEQKDYEVYSCHVSPDGQRLATAGGDGHVRIWSTESIYQSLDPTYAKPRQLCHMSHHLGTIHSVRFSPNNRYLASGADDKIICIYHMDKSPPSVTFASNEPPPVENWKTYKRLIGHENDVQDLAWSPDSSLLVSVGLDSKVVVWSGHSFEKLKVISVHQSHVKGIAFDPANKFFATASDDRTIKIFRYTPPAPNATHHDMINNFVNEATITSPFKSSPLTTYFRRCSWSPDGTHIAAANAVNGPVSSVAIIDRHTWTCDINLIGHEGPAEVCAFAPRLFHTEDPSDANGNSSVRRSLVTVIASAGQDKTLTLWNTNASRPVVIVQDIAGKSIADLSWSPDGQCLFAASLDGSIVALRFAQGELGWPATKEEGDQALERFGVSRKGMGIAEDIEGLNLENQSKEGESKAAQSRMGALMGDFEDGPTQESTSTKANGTTTTTTTTAKGNGSEAKENTSTGKGEKPEEGNGSESKDTPSTTKSEGKGEDRVKELKSRVTIGKDGRKRVAPLLVSSATTGQSSLPQSQLVGSTATKQVQSEAPQSILDLSKPLDGLPKGGIAALLLGNKRKAVAVEEEGNEETVLVNQSGALDQLAAGPIPVMVNTPEGVEPAVATPPENGLVPTPRYLRPAISNPSMAYAQIRLSVPKIRSHIVRSLEKGILLGESTMEEATKLGENIVFEAKNPEQARDPSRISTTKRGVLVWQDFVPRAIVLVTGNRLFWAAACEDGSIYTWTPAGRRLLNPMILESQPVILECRDAWLLCISAVGQCYVWDIRTQSSPHPPVSLGPVLELATTTLNIHVGSPGPGITSAHLSSTGHIVVTLTNGDGYYYARDMYVWKRLSEAWWAVGSQYWNSNDSSISALQSSAVGSVSEATMAKNNMTNNSASSASGGSVNVSNGIIPFLERHTTNEFLIRGRAYTLQRIVKLVLAKDGFEGFESSVSISHLENRIAGALHLGARDEFRLYLFMYAKRLGAEGMRAKVEELLNALVGGIFQDTKKNAALQPITSKHSGGGAGSSVGAGWFSESGDICGWDRLELLQGVVMILGKFREVQRLTVQYARLLNIPLEAEDPSHQASSESAMDVDADHS